MASSICPYSSTYVLLRYAEVDIWVKGKDLVLDVEDCELILIDRKTRTELKQEWRKDKVWRVREKGRVSTFYVLVGMDPVLLVSNVSVEDSLYRRYTGMSLFLLSVTAISRRAEVQEVDWRYWAKWWICCWQCDKYGEICLPFWKM